MSAMNSASLTPPLDRYSEQPFVVQFVLPKLTLNVTKLTSGCLFVRAPSEPQVNHFWRLSRAHAALSWRRSPKIGVAVDRNVPNRAMGPECVAKLPEGSRINKGGREVAITRTLAQGRVDAVLRSHPVAGHLGNVLLRHGLGIFIVERRTLLEENLGRSSCPVWT
jgi:hypothetical protein